jgi:hypothetical protein
MKYLELQRRHFIRAAAGFEQPDRGVAFEQIEQRPKTPILIAG